MFSAPIRDPLADPLDLQTAEATRFPTQRSLLKRLCFVVPVLGLPALGTGMAVSLTADASSPLRWALLGLLFLNLLYLAVTGWPGMLGALVRLAGGPRLAATASTGVSRTAVLFPIYNEDPQPVFAAVEVMTRALIEQDVARTDIFVLSDTSDPTLAAKEAACFAAMRRLFGDRVKYRRRLENHRRKAGNVADFCDQWHGSYDYMVVLDADSLMSAQSITTLVGLMDSNPRTGLIQTVPYAVGRETLFARIQQFAARLYTPLLVEGLAFWQQDDCNYWGHNAIIRIAPFMAHCELPVLPGQEPFGGEILCHDVVEAGLMRRGGWHVWMLPSLGESYEALPANMVDFAQRERRWCQGNLQHLRVLSMRGLRPVGRYHLGVGVLHYISGPLLAAFVSLCMIDACLDGGFVNRLLCTHDAVRDGFVSLTFLLLYGSKLCSLAAALGDDATAEKFGGRVRLIASAGLEQVSAMISLPVLLAFYTRFITMMVLGRSVQWDAQPRDDRGVSWNEAWRCMRFPTLVGVCWLVAASSIGGAILHWSGWIMPALLVAVPFAVWTSYCAAGVSARNLGLFLTEDEVAPSAILRAYDRAMAPKSADLLDSTEMQPSFA